MNKYALIILSDTIKVKQFEHEDDFVTARQSLSTAEKRFIPLKWHDGIKGWVAPEVCE